VVNVTVKANDVYLNLLCLRWILRFYKGSKDHKNKELRRS